MENNTEFISISKLGFFQPMSYKPKRCVKTNDLKFKHFTSNFNCSIDWSGIWCKCSERTHRKSIQKYRRRPR